MRKIDMVRIEKRMQNHQAVLLEKRRREELHRLQEEEENRQRLYNVPLQNFYPLLSRDTRVKFFSYATRVINDAGRAVVHHFNAGILENTHDYMFDTDELRSMLYAWRDIRASDLSCIFRISKMRNGSKVAKLYIAINDPRYKNYWTESMRAGIERRVGYRFRNKLAANIPEMGALYGSLFDVHFWGEKDEEKIKMMKKRGYLYPNEEVVTHLEIF